MRFLIDEDLPRSIGELLRRYGHESIDVCDIGLRGAKDSQVASYAQKNSLCLLTGDFDFSDIRNYPPARYAGIVVLKIPNITTHKFILRIMEEYLKRKELISGTTGKLFIIEPGRIRIRSS